MINVTCAIIRNEDDEVLIVQRGEKQIIRLSGSFPEENYPEVREKKSALSGK